MNLKRVLDFFILNLMINIGFCLKNIDPLTYGVKLTDDFELQYDFDVEKDYVHFRI